MKTLLICFSVAGIVIAIFSGSALLIFKSRMPSDRHYVALSEDEHNTETIRLTIGEINSVIVYQNKMLNLSILNTLSLIVFIFCQSALTAVYLKIPKKNKYMV